MNKKRLHYVVPFTIVLIGSVLVVILAPSCFKDDSGSGGGHSSGILEDDIVFFKDVPVGNEGDDFLDNSWAWAYEAFALDAPEGKIPLTRSGQYSGSTGLRIALKEDAPIGSQWTAAVQAPDFTPVDVTAYGYLLFHARAVSKSKNCRVSISGSSGPDAASVSLELTDNWKLYTFPLTVLDGEGVNFGHIDSVKFLHENSRALTLFVDNIRFSRGSSISATGRPGQWGPLFRVGAEYPLGRGLTASDSQVVDLACLSLRAGTDAADRIAAGTFTDPIEVAEYFDEARETLDAIASLSRSSLQLVNLEPELLTHLGRRDASIDPARVPVDLTEMNRRAGASYTNDITGFANALLDLVASRLPGAVSAFEVDLQGDPQTTRELSSFVSELDSWHDIVLFVRLPDVHSSDEQGAPWPWKGILEQVRACSRAAGRAAVACTNLDTEGESPAQVLIHNPEQFVSSGLIGLLMDAARKKAPATLSQSGIRRAARDLRTYVEISEMLTDRLSGEHVPAIHLPPR